MKIDWSEKSKLGVALIDSQHEYFVTLMSELYDAIQQRSPENVINLILKKLNEYSIFHFSTEENLFDEFNYEFTEEHKKAHISLLSQLASLTKEKEKAQNIYVFAFSLLEFLEDWLVGHIMHEDKKYVPCFKEHGM
jgi:hemerythrin